MKIRWLLPVVLIIGVVLNAQAWSETSRSWSRGVDRLLGRMTPEDTAQQVLNALLSPSTYNWSPHAFKASKATVTEHCQLVEVPLVYEDPIPAWATVNISLSVCSFLRSDTAARASRQVWMIPGGPGETSKTMKDAAVAAVAQFDADVYTMDFRGVGLSSPSILCPRTIVEAGLTQASNEDTWELCGQEVLESLKNYTSKPDLMLKAFNTANAARDYNFVINYINSRPNVPVQKVWLAGYSYGTFLVNRIVYMFPTLAHGVILDGVMTGPQATTLFTDYDLAGDEVFQQIFAACSQDTFCHSKITQHGAKFGSTVMTAMMQGHCRDFTTKYINVASFQIIMRYIMIQTFPVREMIPMLMYRINRCDPYLDGDFLTRVFATFGALYDSIAGKNPAALEVMKSRNLVLGAYIQVNEFIDKTTPTDQLVERFQSSVLGIGLSVTSFRGNIFPALPAKYNDPDGAVLAANYPNATLKSVLFISGAMDSQTPPKVAAVRFQDSFLQAPERHAHTSPSRAHINSLMSQGGGAPNPCAAGIAGAFVRSDGSASTAAAFEKSSQECVSMVWFDYQATTLRRSMIGEGFGLNHLADVWDGSLSTGPSPLAIVLMVLAAIIALAVIIIIISVVLSKKRQRAQQLSTMIPESDTDYRPLQE